MDDFEKYIAKRKRQNSVFAESLEKGYENFKIGILLRRAREESGMTQEQIAKLLNTQKSAISRIENHAEDIRPSTLTNMPRLWENGFNYRYLKTIHLKQELHPLPTSNFPLPTFDF